MLSQRPVDLDNDREFLLDLACMGSYESLPSWYRTESYRVYRERWFASDLPESFLREVAESFGDERTVAEVWMEETQRAGFLWLTFADSPQGRLIGTVRNLIVAPAHQRRGIGSMMLQSAATLARERQAGALRVETSVENEASQAMYAKEGFTVARLLYEKVLDQLES